jgi:hypothetical protein
VPRQSRPTEGSTTPGANKESREETREMIEIKDTEASLCAEYEAWCAANGLPATSADELVHEDISPEQRRYLRDFLLRWEAVMAAEDARWRRR